MMKKYIGLPIAIAFLSGCSNLSIQNFDRSPYSLVSDSKSSVVLRGGTGDWSTSPPLQKYSETNPDFNAAISGACTIKEKAPSEKIAPAFIPIVVSAGKLLFDLQMDKNTKKIEKLKKAAQATYSNRLILTADEFRESTCAVIYRYDENNEAVGFVSVLKLENQGEGFVVSPSYVKANDTVAITKRPEEGQNAKINASIAVSVKAIGAEKSGLPLLTSIGEGVTTVVNIDVGPAGKAACTKGCDSSDLVPYVADKEKVISVTFAVTETGKLGIDLDEKLSEAMAVKEALGPALKDSLKEYLKEDK